MSANSSIQTVEGELEYFVPAANKNCKLWYKVVGDLSSAPPLVTLHGGPGMGHEYLTPLTYIATRYNKAIVFFDQIGSGKSTHLQEKNGDTGFWTDEFFMDQIDRLLAHLHIGEFDLLGHSWGGMLAARYAARMATSTSSIPSSAKLRHLVIISSPASLELSVKARKILLSKLPEDVQAILKKHEEAGTTDSKEYLDASQVFLDRHDCRINPSPPELVASIASIMKDPTVYHTMHGPMEFSVTGSLKTWTIIDDIHKINVPTLLLNGAHDGAMDMVMEPYFEKIPKVKWYTFPNSSHFCMFEEPELLEQKLTSFLLK